MNTEQQITLSQMLIARERRAQKQQELLKKYHASLICFTMNIAGPVKNNPLIRQGFSLGNRYLKQKLSAQKIKCIHQEIIDKVTGNEAYYVTDTDPKVLKKLTVEIEDASPIGRLFDLDVLSSEGLKTERTDLGLAPRICLICNRPAKECARSRTHTVEQLQSTIRQILTRAINESDSKDAASYALRAILHEACTTPKPGLVDRLDNGSHKDMDIFTFMDSASVLWPYFGSCARLGRQTASLSATETFFAIRKEGRKAEEDMVGATGGVNTHKGAIFTMGILCAALGRLDRKSWKKPEIILQECAEMTKGLTAHDFAGLTIKNARTAGQKLYLKYNITGVRGQMEEGLPAVRYTGLPALKAGVARGLSLNEAGCGALLALMTAATDTNLIARSNLRTWQETISRLKILLAENPYPDAETLQQLNQEFIQKNLSPGGSADLLAVCYLLYFLEQDPLLS